MPLVNSETASLTPPASVLDDLELLRNGVFGEAQIGPGELVSVPAVETPVTAGAASVRIEDGEGVPLAVVVHEVGDAGAGVREG